jgi:hypothetical protein
MQFRFLPTTLLVFSALDKDMNSHAARDSEKVAEPCSTLCGRLSGWGFPTQ